MNIKNIITVFLVALILTSCTPANTLTPESIQQPVSSIQRVKIGLDPGHGWGDSKTGAVGNGLIEKDVNLEIALLTKQILENNDFEVAITREGDSYDKKLYQAAEIMNNESPALVVSIHTNSGGNTATGTEGCYTVGKSTDEQSKQLAQLLTESIASDLSVPNRGIYPENSESVCGRGRGRLYIHDMNAPSAIIETGFLSNPTEAELLKNKKHEYAQAIARAIMNYLGVQRPLILSANPQNPEISVTIVAATVESFPRAEIRDECLVFLDDVMIFDMKQGNEFCFGGGEISYSPTGEYFLVVVHQFEGDNDGFVFEVDGSNMRKITAPGDYINYSNYEWTPDGRYIIYQSIYSCCIEPPPGIPNLRTVKYDVYNSQKEIGDTPSNTTIASPEIIFYRVINVANNDVLNIREGAGVNYAIVGTIPPDGRDIQILGDGVQANNATWVPIIYKGISGWVNSYYLAKQ